MANVKISEMTHDTSIGGSEQLPAADAGNAKHITVNDIKSYIVDAIEAISQGTTPTGADGIFMLQGGVLKPVDIDFVAQYAINLIWGKAADTSLALTDTMPLRNADTTEKTVSLTTLTEFVRSTIEAAILDVSNLTAAGALSGTDMFLVTQGTTGKRVTLTEISTAIYASLDTYVAALTAVTTATSADVFYCIQGGTEKKVTLAEIATYLGNPVSGPATTTANGIPQWSNATGDLKDGLVLATEIDDPGSDSKVATEQAVREAIDAELGSYETFFVPARMMTPSTTDGAGETASELEKIVEYTTNHLTSACLIFSGTIQDESAEFDLVMPSEWDRGTIKFKAFWAPGHTDANVGEYIKLTLAAGARADDENMDTALGTGQEVTDQVLADTDCHRTTASAAITVAGTPDLDELIHFKLTRDYDYAGAGSAMDVDLYLFGILIQYKKDYSVDAW